MSHSPNPSKSDDVAALDAMTGGVFSAPTSGERAARLRSWLAREPVAADMQAVYRVLSARDKGAARALRDRLDELRRAREQESLVAEWAQRAQALLAVTRLNIADAIAWQRDAARAGAPLSREPLSVLRAQLSDRIKAVEDLQHRLQVQREAAVLLAQRIETLSTKALDEARLAVPALQVDVPRWTTEADGLMADPAWASLDARQAPLLAASRDQLRVVWESFQAVLAQAETAERDPLAPLPSVPAWADSIRAGRARSGDPSGTTRSPRPDVSPELRDQARQAVQAALSLLETELAAGHGKASLGAASALRTALREHGRLIDDKLDQRCQSALAAAGELVDWQRWRADQLRLELLALAEGLFEPGADGEAKPRYGGRRMQEALRDLRERWKAADQGGLSNQALWRRFDAACTRAHKVVEAWHERQRAELAESRARREALLQELQAWCANQADQSPAPDWKEFQRSLHGFAERWREAGPLGDKGLADLQARWTQALRAAGAPLAQAQSTNVAQRQALIEEAKALVADEHWRVDSVKALQQRWQHLAHAVPLERSLERQLWDAFRAPLDAAFQARQQSRERSQAAAGARDRMVLDAVRALDEAIGSGDAGRIRHAQAALEAALRGGASPAGPPGGKEDAVSEARLPPPPVDDAGSPSAQPARPVVAMRGDDRPGARAGSAAVPAPRTASRDGSRGGLPRSGSREPRRDEPRRDARERDGAAFVPLSPSVMRAQRDAQDRATAALRELATRAHGEALAGLLAAWERRAPEDVPAAAAFGRGLGHPQRAAWVKALAAPAVEPGSDEVVLRLEIAADVPTAAQHLDARRALQLQLLTRRHEPPPADTWPQDVARLLATTHTPERAQRLLAALKSLLRSR